MLNSDFLVIINTNSKRVWFMLNSNSEVILNNNQNAMLTKLKKSVYYE